MKVFNRIGDFAVKNQSGIALGIGLALNVVGMVLTAKAAVKSKELIEEEKKRQDIPPDEDLSFIDTIKVCWKTWIPSLITYGLSFGSILYGKNVDNRKLAAASIAYECLDTFTKEYTEKVKEQIGEEKERHIREDIRREKEIVGDRSVASEDLLLYEGDSYFVDVNTNKMFISNSIKIADSINEFNNMMFNHMDASMNDFYDLIYERTPCALNRNLSAPLFNDLGYSIDDGLLDCPTDSRDYEPGKISFNGKVVPVLKFTFLRHGDDAMPKFIT